MRMKLESLIGDERPKRIAEVEISMTRGHDSAVRLVRSMAASDKTLSKTI